MALIPYKPFSPLREFFEDDFPSRELVGGTDLAMDIYEEGDDVVAKMNLPGIDPDDVDINLDKDRLTISGEYSEEKEDSGKQYSFRQRRYGSFSRSVRLPKLVNEDATEASYKDGVLTVTMPKIDKEKTARQIKIDRS